MTAMSYNNRILIIDDNQKILDVLNSVLSNSNMPKNNIELNKLLEIIPCNPPKEIYKTRCFRVDTVLQGELGFKKVQAAIAEGDPYSVIFIDMRMPPGWDGSKTAKEIRKIDSFVEMIVMTAYSDSSVSQIIRQVQFTDRLFYLKKPFDDEEILQLSDSLSMRWNLEEKNKCMIQSLEVIIDSCYEIIINKNQFKEINISFFLQGLVKQMSTFLDTEDFLIVKVVAGKVVFKLGVGDFEEKSMEQNTNINHLLNSFADKVPLYQIMNTSIYSLIPVTGRLWHGFMVCRTPELEVEGFSDLFKTINYNIVKLLDVIAGAMELEKKVDGYFL
jgi:CheY-like chemotaxis protein